MRDFPLKGFFRTIHTLPLMVAPIAVGATWRLLTVPGLGPLPYYLDQWFGIDFRIGSFPDQAFLTTVVMDVWHWTPLVTLTLLAALSSMPKEPFEQAQIDGANRFQVFWHITLPLLRPAILATVFIRMMDALRTVDEVWMLTGGGPGAATRYIGLYIWRVVFPKTDYGYGSAMSLLTLYLTIVMCWLLYVALMARRGQQRAGVMRNPRRWPQLPVLDRRQPGHAVPDLLDVRHLGEEPRRAVRHAELHHPQLLLCENYTSTLTNPTFQGYMINSIIVATRELAAGHDAGAARDLRAVALSAGRQGEHLLLDDHQPHGAAGGVPAAAVPALHAGVRDRRLEALRHAHRADPALLRVQPALRHLDAARHHRRHPEGARRGGLWSTAPRPGRC